MSRKGKKRRNQQTSQTPQFNMDFAKSVDFDVVNEFAEQALIMRDLALEKALNSTDVKSIMKAKNYLQAIKKKEDVDIKSILVDPLDVTTALGYKHKPLDISYTVLRGMARTHIIKAIIGTRKDQISEFCTPRENKNGVGFIIQKKKRYFFNDDKKTLSKHEEQRIEQIAEFIMKGGTLENHWHADDFDTFVRKIVDDSLTLDQATFEIPTNRAGIPVEFFATDAATFRIADSYEDRDEKMTKKDEIVNGYAPSYVQIHNSRILNEFYPWEMCFGVRNPSTSIYSNGYGRSELEDMIQTVTAILNADSYNANFFKVGSAPKGILKYSGNINPNTVEDFRRQWTAQVAGVMNMHKIPMINADKLDFINTGQNNKDMEFSKFQEFLIKISCAMYKIDPAEVGFPMQGTSESAGLGGNGGTEEKIKYSRAKGLKPLLRKIEKWINKYVVERIDQNYEFKFVGIDEEDDEETELDRDIKALSNFMTINEIRKKRNMDPIENGDIILNPTYLQAVGMAQQGNEESNEAIDDMYGEEDSDEGYDENPFLKSLENELGSLLNEESWKLN